MCWRLPGNSVLSSTKEDNQNILLVTCYLLPDIRRGLLNKVENTYLSQKNMKYYIANYNTLAADLTMILNLTIVSLTT